MKFKFLLGTLAFFSLNALAAPTPFQVSVENHLSTANDQQDTLRIDSKTPPLIYVEKPLPNRDVPGKTVFGNYSIVYPGQSSLSFPVSITDRHLGTFTCKFIVTLNYDETNGFYITYAEQEKGNPVFNCDATTSGKKNLVISIDPIKFA